MSPPNRNALWAQVLVEELARSGVQHACVAPGHRSAPLAFALASQPELRVWSHVDERSMGYFALGLAKATRAPVALACTSGTAAANLLPAVVEAWHGRVPLLVLTADRPHDLRDTGANQAIHQAGLFGTHVRWSADLPLPVVEGRSLRHLRVLACRAVAEAQGPPAGPVHLNVPFTKPLGPEPRDDIPADFARAHPRAARGAPEGGPFVRVRAERRTLAPETRDRIAEDLHAERGLLVAGPEEDPRLPGAMAALARATGFPLLADPLSNLRFGPHAGLVAGAYDGLLRSAAMRGALRPEVVLRVGAAPTSSALLEWLEDLDAPHLLLDEAPHTRDPLHVPGERVACDPALACEALAAALPAPTADAAWTQRWRTADGQARALAQEALRGPFFEAHAAEAVLDALPEGATLVVGNSLPARDLDRFGAPMDKPLRVLGNRGASGIDGVTSTALGIAAAAKQGEGPVALLTGDLSFYHDLPGLLAVKRLGIEAVMVVVHNDGGRIFDQLPVAALDPPYTELFATPHGLDFQHAARLFGARFAEASDAKALREHLGEALEARGSTVLQVRVDPVVARQARERLARALHGPK